MKSLSVGLGHLKVGDYIPRINANVVKVELVKSKTNRAILDHIVYTFSNGHFMFDNKGCLMYRDTEGNLKVSLEYPTFKGVVEIQRVVLDSKER